MTNCISRCFLTIASLASISPAWTQSPALANQPPQRADAFQKPADLAIARPTAVPRDDSGRNGRERFNVGFNLQAHGKYRNAIAAYLSVFEKDNEECMGSHIMASPENCYHRASRGLADCYEKLGDYQNALEWLELASHRFCQSSFCGNCMAAVNMELKVQRARLLARLGRRMQAIKLLEPLVLQEVDDLAVCPPEAAWILVDTYYRPEQIDAFERKLNFLMSIRQEAAARLIAEGKDASFLEESMDVTRTAAMAIELLRTIERRSARELWSVIEEFGYSALDIFSDRDSDRVNAVRIFSRRAAMALIALPDAGPFLLEKLQGTEREQGWALLLLALMKHPDAPTLFERMAAASLKDQQPNPYTHELRQCLCCAIALHDHANSRWLMTRYGIGTRNKVFDPQDLRSLHDVRVMIGLSKPVE